ncbi:hypothetical protein AAHC03_020847 [Spirometra sp. Aus1]
MSVEPVVDWLTCVCTEWTAQWAKVTRPSEHGRSASGAAKQLKFARWGSWNWRGWTCGITLLRIQSQRRRNWR